MAVEAERSRRILDAIWEGEQIKSDDGLDIRVRKSEHLRVIPGLGLQ